MIQLIKVHLSFFTACACINERDPWQHATCDMRSSRDTIRTRYNHSKPTPPPPPPFLLRRSGPDPGGSVGARRCLSRARNFTTAPMGLQYSPLFSIPDACPHLTARSSCRTTPRSVPPFPVVPPIRSAGPHAGYPYLSPPAPCMLCDGWGYPGTSLPAPSIWPTSP